MLNRRLILDLALQHPEYRAPLVRLATHLTALSGVPSSQEIEKAVANAGNLDAVDPTVAAYIVQSGLLDGETGDDVVSAGKGSWAATALNPSQKTMILAKAIGMALGMLKKGKIGGDLGAIVSKDKHILDGHHRWAATILAGGGKGKVGGYAAALPGKELLKVLNIISKGLFNVRSGNPGKGKISDFKPANVRAMLEDFTTTGIGGEFPVPADAVKSILEDAFGSVEEGIDKMAENVKLMSQKVPGWAPDRKQMPVIDVDQVPEASQALNQGLVDFSKPHAPGSKTAAGPKMTNKGDMDEWGRRYLDWWFSEIAPLIGKEFDTGKNLHTALWLATSGNAGHPKTGLMQVKKALADFNKKIIQEVEDWYQQEEKEGYWHGGFYMKTAASGSDPTARAARIRLASSMPVGSDERRAILAGIQKGAKAKMIRVPGGNASRNVGYSEVIAGEPDEVRRGDYGTAARVGREWFSVNLLWSKRQMRQRETPHASKELGIDPRIELWGVRGPFHGEPNE